jgi:hypothetical protein
MAQTSFRCPECDARIKVIVSPGRTSVRCPECGARVPLPDEESENEDDDRPARRSRQRDDDDEEEEDDAPRARRRRERDEDDEDDDDRPRRRKKQRREEGDGPWLAAAGVAALGFVTTFGGALLVKGTEGLAPGEDGPIGKLFGLGLCLLVALVLAPLGVYAVKNRTAYGRWGIKVSGNMGVVLGIIQAAMGGLVGGYALYGVLFTLIRGR